MKNVGRISKKDILGIKPGESEEFLFDSAKATRSAVTYVYQLAQYEDDLPEEIGRASCRERV